MGFFKGYSLFKGKGKKGTAKDGAALEEKVEVAPTEPIAEVAPTEPIADPAKETTEPAAEPAVAGEVADTVEALPESKAGDALAAKDDASTVAESSKDGDAPEAGKEQTAEAAAETALVIPASIALEENMPAKASGWFSCALCK
jgi:hypothetical protein